MNPAALRVVALAGGLAVGACTLGPSPSPVTVYDFGPALGAPAPSGVPGVAQVVAPPWLDGTAIVYRLAYADASRVAVYRDSRWTAPPPALLQEHLRQRIARSPQVRADRRLHVELEEFSHLFALPQASSAVVRLRATVTEGATGRGLGQQTFEARVEARTNDAQGGAHALSAAASQVGARVLDWAGRL